MGPYFFGWEKVLSHEWTEEKQIEFERLCELERLERGRVLTHAEEANIWESLNPKYEPVVKPKEDESNG